MQKSTMLPPYNGSPIFLFEMGVSLHTPDWPPYVVEDDTQLLIPLSPLPAALELELQMYRCSRCSATACPCSDEGLHS